MSENSPSLKPVPKVSAAGVAGALTTVIVFGVALLGVDVPDGVAAALTALLTFGAGYLKKP